MVGVIVPRDREGLQLLDDWDGAGQRLTASGTTVLDNMLVYPDEIRSRPARAGGRSPGHVRSPSSSWPPLLAGIARNALDDAVTFTREHARPIKHSVAERSVEDPYVQHAVGEISSRAFVAEAGVLRAAQSLDQCPRPRAHHRNCSRRPQSTLPRPSFALPRRHCAAPSWSSTWVGRPRPSGSTT